MKYIQTVNQRGYVNLYFRSPTGFRVALPAMDDPSFAVVYGEAMQRAEMELRARRIIRGDLSEGEEAKRLAKFYGRMAARMRHRASALDVACEIGADDLKVIAEAQDHRCALTGIVFIVQPSTRGRGSPFAPSPDRVESAKGYVAGNVRMVCQMANYARLDFSDDEFYRMCAAATEWRAKALKEGSCKTDFAGGKPSGISEV